MSIEVSTVSEKGQVTIPKEVRDHLTIKPGDKVLFVIEDGKVSLTKPGAKKVSEVLRKQKPWTIGHMEFQASIRNEWL
ncbi:MAG: AbrB/MazE/SpoVT family DNA-binding domain-containing protein [Nitrososphaerota archaeon]